MRVHRSWWVARAGVDGIETAGDRMTIRLVSGAVAPVSRANRSAVRAWISG
jgi:DNA-binding LytR/AlgR family response regulator